MGALVTRGLERLEADPAVRELILACQAWDAAIARVAKRPKPRDSGRAVASR